MSTLICDRQAFPAVVLFSNSPLKSTSAWVCVSQWKNTDLYYYSTWLKQHPYLVINQLEHEKNQNFKQLLTIL